MARGRRRLGPVVALVITGWTTACGGRAAPPPSALPAPRIDARPTDAADHARPAGREAPSDDALRGFADTEPAPTLAPAGADPTRAAAALLAYSAWLHAHRPDDALVTTAVAPGTALERLTRRELTTLRRTGRRLIETTAGPDTIRPVSVTDHAASLRVVQDLTGVVLIGADGRTVDRMTASRTSYLVLLVRTDATAPWRLADIQEEGPA